MGLSWTRGYVHDDTHNFRDSPPGLAINKNANITCLKVYFVHRLTSRGGRIEMQSYVTMLIYTYPYYICICFENNLITLRY